MDEWKQDGLMIEHGNGDLLAFASSAHDAREICTQRNTQVSALQSEIDSAMKMGKLILNHLPKAKRLFPDGAESDSLDLIMTKLVMIVVEPNEEEE